MKKNSKISTKSNGLKDTKNLKLLIYAKNLSVIITLIFLIYFVLQINVYKGDVQRLFLEAPTNVIGFIASLVNLYIWFELNTMIEDIKSAKNIETIRLKLIIMVIAQVILFNLVTVTLLTLSLVKYFKWKDVKILNLFKNIKIEGQNSSVLLLASVLFICILLTYTIIPAIV